MEIEEYIHRFKTDYQFRLRPKTLKAYQYAVKEFVNEVGKPLEEIQKREIRLWLNTLSERGFKPNTVHSKLTCLKTFLTYCYEEGYISVNPAKGVKYPKKGEAIPYYLTRRQLAQLRRVVEGKKTERAVIEVLYTTGIRISELAKMKKEDIDWAEKCILIPEGKGKKGRIVMFTPECAEHLKVHLSSRTDDLSYVFVNARADKPVRIQTVNEKFRFYSKQLGFRVTPHVLRHTFAAYLAHRGMPLYAIQRLLGHCQQDTTLIYARLYEHARKEVYDEWM